jgi:hypothetical protein
VICRAGKIHGKLLCYSIAQACTAQPKEGAAGAHDAGCNVESEHNRQLDYESAVDLEISLNVRASPQHKRGAVGNCEKPIARSVATAQHGQCKIDQPEAARCGDRSSTQHDAGLRRSRTALERHKFRPVTAAEFIEDRDIQEV